MTEAHLILQQPSRQRGPGLLGMTRQNQRQAIPFHPSRELRFVNGWFGGGPQPLTLEERQKLPRVRRPGCPDRGLGNMKRLFFS